MTWQDVARRQHGLITRAQLRSTGRSDRSIDHLIRSGHLRPDRIRGVLRSSTVHATAMTESWSAVLATRSVLSHFSAAAAWGISAPDDGMLHVTAPRRRKTVMPAGVRVHRTLLPAGAIVDRAGLAMTDRRRTVLDCLGLLPRHSAATLFDRSLQQNLLTLADVSARLDAEPGRPGNTVLRWLLREASRGDAESERTLHRILRGAGIGGWAANRAVGRYVGDVVFAAQRLILEVDGWAYHSSVESFRRDRRRQNALVVQGWTVIRFSWADLSERPDYVVSTVRRALANADLVVG